MNKLGSAEDRFLKDFVEANDWFEVIIMACIYGLILLRYFQDIAKIYSRYCQKDNQAFGLVRSFEKYDLTVFYDQFGGNLT